MGKPAILQIERIYYPVLSAVGVPVNLIAIMILSRGQCGLSKCITYYLVGMSTADLLVVIIDPILRWNAQIYYPDSFLNITPVCSLIYVLRFATTIVSVWLTVAFTFDRFVAICCENLKSKYCTAKAAALVIGNVSMVGCFVSVPWYFIYEPYYTIDNVPWDCIAKKSFFSSSIWGAFDMFHRVLTPCVPFIMIVLLNVLTVRRILIASRVRKGFRGQSNGENLKDTEIENRRKSIILLFSISGSFILLWITRVVYQIYARITNIQYYYSYSDPRYITESTSMMLQLLSTCTNTCIYVLTQARFREELKNALKCPFILIVKLGSA
ncbi:probable G-protein coupled receptor 139 [Scyliorhinus canicula]|uniref:probable G-protein coupled receptor 139 n=1 Tax=Scyliorhinus canicula TaxID=7830 RepID=UPI0018F53D48|nr:probable G-protein coupled receptor 139 [Scyliorhinus canicula]